MAREPHTKSQLIHPPVSEEPIRENPCQNTHPHLRPFRRLRAERRGRPRRPSLRPDFHRSPIPSPWVWERAAAVDAGSSSISRATWLLVIIVHPFSERFFLVTLPKSTYLYIMSKEISTICFFERIFLVPIPKRKRYQKRVLVTLPNTCGANAWFRYQQFIYLVCPF